MNEFKLQQCLDMLDKVFVDMPNVLMEDAAHMLMRELHIDYVDAGLAVKVWIQLRTQPSPKSRGWTDV